MGRSEKYRRYAKQCLEMANAIQDPKGRAALLQMAQVWLRLAQHHDEEEKSDQLTRNPISSPDKSSSDPFPWRLSPRLAPCPLEVCGAPRFCPRGPCGGIPPQPA